jgi:hypothetical protein
VEFGCDYCADEHNFHYGHVTQIGSSGDRRRILIQCPRCGTLYENTANGPDDIQRLTPPASSTAIRRTNLTHHDAPSDYPASAQTSRRYWRGRSMDASFKRSSRPTDEHLWPGSPCFLLADFVFCWADVS